MKRTAITAAGVYGFLGVAIGAFGAHAWHDQIAAHGRLDTFETGTFYHLVHALFLLGIGIIYPTKGSKLLKVSIIGTIIGILVFSGSLYVLSLTGLNWLGAITPIGGLAFLTAWTTLILYARTLNTTP